MGGLSLIAVFALAAADPSLVPGAPAAATSPEALRFDEPPAPPTPPEDKRVQRFLGALAGGALGFATPLALLPLGDAACFFGPCASPVHSLLGMLAPLSGALGAWAGSQLAGGRGGLLTATAAVLPGALVAAPLFALAAATGASLSMMAFLPYLITVGAVFAGAAALALDARAQQLEVAGVTAEAPAGRVALVTLATALAGALGVVSSALVFASCFGAACVGAGTALALSSAIGTAAVSWAVHAAMGGRGSFLSALLGMGIAGLATTITVPFLAAAGLGFPILPTASAIAVATLAVGGAVLFPVLALEWSHAAVLGSRSEGVQLSAAPMPGGGVMSAALRF